MCGIFGITKTTKFNQSNVSGATLLCRRFNFFIVFRHQAIKW